MRLSGLGAEASTAVDLVADGARTPDGVPDGAGRRRRLGGRPRARAGDALRASRSTAANRSPDPRCAWQPGRRPTARPRSSTTRRSLDRRRLARRRRCPARCSTSCTSARSPPEGTFDARDRAARPPGRPRGRRRRADAGREFPGRHGWGYDGVGPVRRARRRTAARRAEAASSTPATRRGLGVVLDVVYNHLGPSGQPPRRVRALLHRPLRHPVGRRGQPRRRRQRRGARASSSTTPDVAARLPRRRAAARRRARPRRRPGGRPSSRSSRSRSRRPRPRLGKAAVAHRRESDLNDPARSRRARRGGLGLHAQWADDVHHALHVALTGETPGLLRRLRRPGRV